jgi:hypothetical protein
MSTDIAIPETAKIGDKIKINDKEIILNNSFELVIEGDEEYYNIKTKK